MKTKARPGLGGNARRSDTKASSPPAEAPMPTIGKVVSGRISRSRLDESCDGVLATGNELVEGSAAGCTGFRIPFGESTARGPRFRSIFDESSARALSFCNFLRIFPRDSHFRGGLNATLRIQAGQCRTGSASSQFARSLQSNTYLPTEKSLRRGPERRVETDSMATVPGLAKTATAEAPIGDPGRTRDRRCTSASVPGTRWSSGRRL